MNTIPVGFRNNNDAWALTMKWSPWIRKYTHNKMNKSTFKDRLVYQDLVQDAFLACFRAAKTFDESKGCCFQTYARYWIDCYVFQKDALKRQINMTIYRDFDYNVGDEYFIDNIFLSEQNVEMEALIGTIKDKDKILQMYVVEDKTTKEIGEILGVSRQTISNRMRKLGNL